MKEKKRNFQIGLFIVSSLALLLAIVYYFGMSDFFTPKVTLYTVFSESVQGLTRGGAVKYRGAPIGSVSKITILIKQKVVLVEMQVSTDSLGGSLNSASRCARQLKDEIANGMRCRLEYAGITGLKFIDFDFFGNPNDEYEVPAVDAAGIYIPSVSSMIKDVTRDITNSLERISRIPFEQISSGILDNLAGINNFITDPALMETIYSLKETAEHLQTATNVINQAIKEDRLNTMLDEMQSGMTQFSDLMGRMNSTIVEMRLPESSNSFRQAADALVSGEAQMSNTLLKLNQTLESLKMLTDYLSSDPNALINGKKSQYGLDPKLP